jgi:hypothetical protein
MPSCGQRRGAAFDFRIRRLNVIADALASGFIKTSSSIRHAQRTYQLAISTSDGAFGFKMTRIDRRQG